MSDYNYKLQYSVIDKEKTVSGKAATENTRISSDVIGQFHINCYIQYYHSIDNILILSVLWYYALKSQNLIKKSF